MGNVSSTPPGTPKLQKRWYSTQTTLSLSSSYSGFSIVSANRPWSRKSKRHIITTTLQDVRLEDSKTNWPTSHIESLFLPEYPLKNRLYESQFQILRQITQGAFGSVLEVKKKGTGERYAMKALSKSKVMRENAIRQVKDEVTIQSLLGHHPFIVKCEYYWQNRRQLFILTGFVTGGELLLLWKKYEHFSEDLVQLYIAELAIAIDFLHNTGVMYRDLKMENILLDEQGHLQLIDFGLSKWVSQGCRAQTICGTIQYMAPEILSMEPYTHAVDWWSLGIIMYALLIGSYPVESEGDHAEMVKKVQSCSYQLPEHLSVNARLVLRKLLCKMPKKRLQHLENLKFEPFFRTLNFSEVYEKKSCPNEILRKEPSRRIMEVSEKSVCALVEFFEDFNWTIKDFNGTTDNNNV